MSGKEVIKKGTVLGKLQKDESNWFLIEFKEDFIGGKDYLSVLLIYLVAFILPQASVIIDTSLWVGGVPADTILNMDYHKLSNVGWNELEIAFLTLISLGAILSMAMAVILFVIMVEIEEEIGKLMKGIFLTFIFPIYTAYKLCKVMYLTLKGGEVSKKSEYYIGKFNESLEDGFDILNKVVRLENGYITYLNNIIKSTAEGLKTTTKSEYVPEGSKESYIVEGKKITDENIEGYYKMLYSDYINDKEYNQLMNEQVDLVNKEKERIEIIEYIRENKDKNSELRTDVEGVLAHNIREESINKKKEEVRKELERIKEDISKLEVR